MFVCPISYAMIMSTSTPSACRMMAIVSGCVQRSLTNLDLDETFRSRRAPLPYARAQFSKTSDLKSERRYATTPSHDRKGNGLLPAILVSSPGSVMPKSANVNVFAVVHATRCICNEAVSRKGWKSSINQYWPWDRTHLLAQSLDRVTPLSGRDLNRRSCFCMDQE